MSTPELEQAIAAEKWKGAPGTIAEAIADVLSVDVDTVARVVYAWEAVRDLGLVNAYDDQCADMFAGVGAGDPLPPDVRRAIMHTTARAFRRVAVRWRMEHGLHLDVPFNKLLAHHEHRRMCDGCTWQLECVRDMLSTPAKCYEGKYVVCKDQPYHDTTRQFRHQYARVEPLRLKDATVIVRAEHPRGTYEVNLMDVRV